MMNDSGKVLVVGLGSAHGDDQAGWLVAEQLLKKVSVLKKVSGTLEASEGQVESLMRESSRHFFQHVVVRRAMIPLDVLDWLEGVSILHVCDACETTGSHEKLMRFTWTAGRLVDSDKSTDSGVNASLKLRGGRGSHDFGLLDVLQLAKKTGLLPKHVIIWAISGKCFRPADVMSDDTKNTVCQAVDAVMKELSRILCGGESAIL